MKRNVHRKISTATACLFLVVVVVSSVTATSYGQEQGKDLNKVTPTLTEDGKIILNQKVSVAGLLDYVSEKLDISFIWDSATETALTGPNAPTITLRMKHAIGKDELFGVLQAVLQAAPTGYAIVETSQPNLYKLVQMKPNSVSSDHIFVLGDDYALPDIEDSKATAVTVIVRLRNVSAQEIQSSLSILLNPASGGVVTPVGTSGLVILTGQRSRIEAALNIIKMLPENPDELTFAVMELKNLDPSSVVGPITNVMNVVTATSNKPRQPNSRPNITVVTAIPGTKKIVVTCPKSKLDLVKRVVAQFDSGEAAETRIYTPTVLPADEFAKMAQKLLTTSSGGGRGAVANRATVEAVGTVVMVNASPTQHDKVEQLLKKFEDLPAHQRQIVRYFRVRHRAASEIMDVLENLYSSGEIKGSLDRSGAPAEEAGRRSAGNEAASAPNRQPPGQQNQQPTISLASENEKLLEITLDEKTNTLIAKCEPNIIDQVAKIVSDLDVRQPQVMLEVFVVTLSENQALEVGAELQGEFQWGATSMNLSSLFGLGLTSATSGGTATPGTGFTGLAINPGDFSAILRALQTVGAAQASSKPAILVNNNEEATLKGVAEEPVSTTSQGDATSVTSFGGTEDAGTTLTITPQIAEGNHLILTYSVELSSFTGDATNLEGGGRLPPPKRTDKIDSVVTIPDGYTVVVGGLEDSSEKETVNKVPLLGDLPFIGEAFKSTNRSKVKNKLYVFIRATVLRDLSFQDLRYLSGDE